MLGTAVIHTTPGETMPAYVLIDIDIQDSDRFGQYVDAITPMLEAADARAVSFDPNPSILEGDWTPSTIVVLEFPTKTAADRFFAADEYQPLRTLRHSIATTNIVITETAAAE
jgi:uncharacterized protein (DUF1330 family)